MVIKFEEKNPRVLIFHLKDNVIFALYETNLAVGKITRTACPPPLEVKLTGSLLHISVAHRFMFLYSY